MVTDKVRTLILGAGVSGLAFADWLKSPDLLVCEAQDEIGGYCKTIHQDGFTWDFSGHFFHFKDKAIEAYLVARMGQQAVRVVRRESRIHYRGRLIDFPFQKNIHQLEKEEFIDCLVDLFFADRGTRPANFQDMLVARFGRGIAEKFLIPYNEKLYATDLTSLDPEAMGRFFPWARLEEIIANFRRPENASYNSTFTYPQGGAIQYVNALAQGVPAGHISLSERVERIDLRHKVATTGRREIAFERLVSAAPFNQLLAMTGLAHDPEIYSWNKVLVFNLGFDRKGIEGIHWIYYPERDLCFYRDGFYDNIFETDRMSLYVEIGFPAGACLDEAAAEAWLPKVLADLRTAGVVVDHQLVSHHRVLLDPAYVHITGASMADVAHKKRVLESRGVYSIGRYGSWTYCSIEDNIVEARALAEVFNAADA